MVPLKFAAVTCLLYFSIFVNAGKKPTCKTVLERLDKMESQCQGTFRNVVYLCIELLKSVVSSRCKYLNSEQQLTYMWFLWSDAESDDCDGTDVCAAIKSLGMKLEAKLENLYSLVENISMSLHPPPGKLGVTDLLAWFFNVSFLYSFFVTSALYELYFLQLRALLARSCMTTGKLTVEIYIFHILFSPCFW